MKLNLEENYFSVIVPKETLTISKMIVKKLSEGVIKIEDKNSRFNCYRILETPEKYTLCYKRGWQFENNKKK